ncbi:uncharacterized protein LOC106668542 [Cimex lectularius]|uniref:RRM domain-containing protein n=1 Tax=Cimex lectularius TaxID=79782 RepID=A0A8I6S3T6_CIMLE|nr:uncharacterized protein LOC106668542 [Cimex lectularius]
MANVLHLASNGCYGVMLHGGTELEDAEIKKMLQTYGKVHEIQRGGPNCFVYFKEYEEARGCIDALASDPKFQARPAKPRETKEKSDVRETRPMRRDPSRKLRSKSEIRKEDFDRITFNTERTKIEKERHLTFAPDCIDVYRRTENRKSTTTDTGDRLNKSQRFSNSRTSKEFQRNSDNGPPHLIHCMDLWMDFILREFGIRNAVEVILGNLPLLSNMQKIYALTSTFVDVINVVMVERGHNYSPYAKVFVTSHDDANILKQRLHHHILGGKRIFVQFAENLIM